jgi:hypothetical protein
MAAAITHNIDAVVKGLTTYQRTDLPRAARKTMHEFGYDFAKRYVPGYMKAVFQRPNNLTLRSLNYKVVSSYEVHFDFRQNLPKGNDPARYLYPVTKGLPGNEAYATKFTRYVHSAGIVPRNRYPIPVKENLKKNSYGKVSQGEYTKTWSGLERTGGAGKTGKGFRYFSIPDGRNRGPASTRQGSLFNLGEGIYRVKGKSDLQLLFTYAKSKPRVPEIFDYYGFAEKTVKFRLGPMFSRNLR